METQYLLLSIDLSIFLSIALALFFFCKTLSLCKNENT